MIGVGIPKGIVNSCACHCNLTFCVVQILARCLFMFARVLKIGAESGVFSKDCHSPDFFQTGDPGSRSEFLCVGCYAERIFNAGNRVCYCGDCVDVVTEWHM